MANGNRRTAVLLYERNTNLSESLYGVTQATEVALRNAIHRTLTSAHGSMWFASTALDAQQADMISEAKITIEKRNRIVTPGSMVAELNLGFWASLIAAKYEKLLWVPHLHKTFLKAERSRINGDKTISMIKLDRSEIHNRIERIRFLRNRIAHHEPILKLDLHAQYLETLEALTWVCPTSAEWVRVTNCFNERFARVVPIPKIVLPAPPPTPRPGMPTPRP